jgi:tetratricopeptide (TPR) repeat protein
LLSGGIGALIHPTMRRKFHWRRGGVALAFLLSVVAAQAHGDFHSLITAANQDIEKDPTNAELYLRRGELFRLHQQFDSAQKDIDTAETLAPGLPTLDLARARLLLDTAWPLSARAHLDRFLKTIPNHTEAFTLRSHAWARLGQPLYAADDLARAIAVTPEGAPDLYIERARALAEAGPDNLEAALQGLDDGMKRMGPLVTLQLTAIDLELRRKNHDAALARIDVVMQRSPRKESWLARKGEILLQAGRTEEAKKSYEAALAALNTLPPGRRNVPAVKDLERRIRLEIDHLSDGTSTPRKDNVSATPRP